MPPTLFQKIFNKRNAFSPPPRCNKEDPSFSWTSPQLDPSQMRLIVYQDCERRGRTVVFDSSAKKRSSEDAPAMKMCGSEAQVKMQGKCCQLRPTGGSTSSLDSSSSCASEPREPSREPNRDLGLRFQGSRCSSDANMLGEMMFGSVAMSYKGSTLKIHQIRSPPQLMLTKVFTGRTGSSIYGSMNTLQDSLELISQDSNTLRPEQVTGTNVLLGNIGFSQLCSPRRAFSEQGPLRLIKSASFFSGHSNPMDMPGRSLYDERDSGIARSASLSSLLVTPFPSPGSSLNSSQASSYQRRWLRSQTTSLENGVFPRWSVEESFNMSDESGAPNLGVARKKKIAIGIIFLLSQDEEDNSRFQDFFFSHFPVFESHMNKLKSAIEQAMKMIRSSPDASQRAVGYSRMMDGLNDFRTTIVNLYTMPRVAEPVWLTMMSGAPEKNQLCGQFMKELSLLMEQASKNQFLPALLTAVLTNHLAWVPTVMPNGQPPIKIFLEKHSSQSVDLLAKTHPYNPLWAQLGDLYGAIGSPVRLSRTVVIGRKQELVQRLLYVLTYFIRCSELLETHMLDSAEDEAIVIPGSLITTSLRRGEVEESDYVLVTMHKPSGDYLSQGPEPQGHSSPSSTRTDTEAAPGDHSDGDSSNSNTQSSKSSIFLAHGHNSGPHTEDVAEPRAVKASPPCVEARLEAVGSAPHREPTCVQPEACREADTMDNLPAKVFRSLGIPLEKKPPDKSTPVPVPGLLLTNQEEEPSNKVLFLIGDPQSPESDTEARSKRVEEDMRTHKCLKEKQRQQQLLRQAQQQLRLQQQQLELQKSQQLELQKSQQLELQKSQQLELQKSQQLELQKSQQLELQKSQQLELQKSQQLELQKPQQLELQKPQQLELQKPQQLELQKPQQLELQKPQQLELQKPQQLELQKPQQLELQKPQQLELQKPQQLELQKPQQLELQKSQQLELQKPQQLELQKPQQLELQKPQQLELQKPHLQKLELQKPQPQQSAQQQLLLETKDGAQQSTRSLEERAECTTTTSADQPKTNQADRKSLTRVSRNMSHWTPVSKDDGSRCFDEYFSSENPVETRTTDDVVRHLVLSIGMDKTQKELLDPSGVQSGGNGHEQEGIRLVGQWAVGGDGAEAALQTRYGSEPSSCRSGSAEQDKGIVISVTIPQGDDRGDQQKKAAPLNDWEIPRNESTDSALGDSESEDAGHDIRRQNDGETYYRDPEEEEWQDEVDIPFPGSKLVENFSKPIIANFGRSLFGGYCPTYVPDFVLQGIPNEDKLRQGLQSELAHAVQHPVFDEPIAEAVCIIADMDKWSVQVASSQRRTTDNRLGKEVLVSCIVSSLLQSTYQLYKMNLSPNFCIMHLEDRLQEIYFKSKMLAEYLKGQTRVHVKELGMVLGIESSDLPLLAAVASTHSPYVAQILL